MTILLKNQRASYNLEFDTKNSRYRMLYNEAVGIWKSTNCKLNDFKGLGWKECNIKLENK